MQRTMNERGSIFPFVALLMVGFLGAFYLLAIVTSELAQASRAQTAADAAALAGSSQGPYAAEEAASKNGAQISDYRKNTTVGDVAEEAIEAAANVASRGATGKVAKGVKVVKRLDKLDEDEGDADVTVTVRVGDHEATARARSGSLLGIPGT